MIRRETFSASLALLAMLLLNSTGCSSVPDECDQEAPLLAQPACLRALQARCEGVATREECEAQDVLAFNDRAIEFEAYCGLMDVVEFRDAASCEPKSSRTTCVGLLSDNSEIACSEGCDASPPILPERFGAISATELIYLPCDARGGPAGLADFARFADENGGSCWAPDGGEAPPVCQCIPDACAELGER